MRPSSVLLTSLAALLLVAIGRDRLRSQPRGRSEGPLYLEEVVHDFGTVTWAERPSHAFRFANMSSRDVTIAQVEEPCSCTLARLSQRRLRPGQHAVLDVSFLPMGYSGRVEKDIGIRLAGYGQPVTVRLRARVNPLLEPSPSRIRFGEVRLQEQPTSTVVLRNTSGQPVKLTAIDTTARQVQAYLLPPDPAVGENPAVRVSLVNPPPGRLSERVTIQTSLRLRPVIEIPVEANVHCTWGLSAHEFFFGFVTKGDRVSRKVVIQRLPPADVTRVDTDVPGTALSAKVDKAKGGAVVTASLDSTNANAGPLKGSVFIHLKGNTQPSLCLPVVGIVQDPATPGSCCPG